MLVREQMMGAPQGCDRARLEHESANQNSAHSSTTSQQRTSIHETHSSTHNSRRSARAHRSRLQRIERVRKHQSSHKSFTTSTFLTTETTSHEVSTDEISQRVTNRSPDMQQNNERRRIISITHSNRNSHHDTTNSNSTLLRRRSAIESTRATRSHEAFMQQRSFVARSYHSSTEFERTTHLDRSAHEQRTHIQHVNRNSHSIIDSYYTQTSSRRFFEFASESQSISTHYSPSLDYLEAAVHERAYIRFERSQHETQFQHR
jgi:hypothetical protein